MTDTKLSSGAPHPDRQQALETANAEAAIAPSDVPTIVVLIGLALMMQVAVNIMIPALPAIGTSLDANTFWSGLTLTGFMLGYGLSPLVLGPLSDRFGRRPVVIYGLALYSAGGIACALAPSIEILVVARVLQGVGGGAGLVNSRAITRDLFSGAKFSRVNAYHSAGQGIGPLLAPVIGALLQEAFGWRSTFAFTAVFGAALLLAYSTIFSETNTRRLTRLDIAALKRGYREVVGSRRFLQPVLTSSLSLASWYTFFAAAPALFIEQFGMSPSEFGLIISTQVTGFVGATILTGRKAALWGEDRLIGVGRLLSVAGVTSVGLVALAGNLSPYTILPPMIVYAAGSGLLFPLLTAAALRPFSYIAGTASSTFIATFQIICAMGTVAASLSTDFALEAFFAVMFAAQCLSVMAYRLLRSPAETPTSRGMR